MRCLRIIEKYPPILEGDELLREHLTSSAAPLHASVHEQTRRLDSIQLKWVFKDKHQNKDKHKHKAWSEFTEWLNSWQWWYLNCHLLVSDHTLMIPSDFQQAPMWWAAGVRGFLGASIHVALLQTETTVCWPLGTHCTLPHAGAQEDWRCLSISLSSHCS